MSLYESRPCECETIPLTDSATTAVVKTCTHVSVKLSQRLVKFAGTFSCVRVYTKSRIPRSLHVASVRVAAAEHPEPCVVCAGRSTILLEDELGMHALVAGSILASADRPFAQRKPMTERCS